MVQVRVNALAGHQDDQILPPGLPGYKGGDPTRSGPDYAKAKALMGNKTGGCKATSPCTRATAPIVQNLAQAVITATTSRQIGMRGGREAPAVGCADHEGGDPRRAVRHEPDRLVRGLPGSV